MSNKKLSERLETLNLDGTTVGWEDCQHCESIIEAVRELEVANEQLQDAYSKDHLTWKKDAEKLYARLGQDRESLTYEIKLCMDERDALRAKVEALRREYRELEESVGYAEHTAAQSAIRERDEARAIAQRNVNLSSEIVCACGDVMRPDDDANTCGNCVAPMRAERDEARKELADFKSRLRKVAENA